MDNPDKEDVKLSFGQQAVGLTFNPSNNPDVQELKELYTQVIDKLDIIKAHRDDKSYPSNIIDDEAIRSAMDAQMWAVKAATYNL